MENRLKELFTIHFGEPVQKLTPLKGDGSHRKIYRLSSAHRSAIGISSSDTRENRAFLGFSKHFREIGLPVPEIYCEDLEQGIYLEQDLGDTTLFKHLSDNRSREGLSKDTIRVYEEVVSILPRFQIAGGRSLDYRLCYPRGSFDRQSMLWDLNYFKYYFLRLGQIPFDEQALEEDFERFTDYLLAADRDYFLYRDFQSRNVMLLEDRPFFIDFQGGRKGALQYDIASLLFDAKADLPFELRIELLQCYLDALGEIVEIDRQEFMKYYPGYVLIRIMQAMGAYGLRGFYERKAHFLQSIPYAVRNLEYLLDTIQLPVELPALWQVFRRMVASSALRQFGEAELDLTVRIESFSYRNGMPGDDKGHGGGFVFDCRGLPNPGRYEKFAHLTGSDPEVIAFLEKEPPVQQFLGHVFGLIDAAVENYRSRNFTHLLVTFGCTGGQHRSVYCANRLAEHLREKYGVGIDLRHREQEKE
jgi:aminoglycoside/choline kinase family phosphotransferase